MLSQAGLLCLMRVLICAGGLAPGIEVVDTASVAAAIQPLRPVRLVPPADLPPDGQRLRPGLAARAAEVWFAAPAPAVTAGEGAVLMPSGEAFTTWDGFLHFAEPGRYQLRLTAAEPVRLTIAGLAIYDSPGVPAGGASPPLPLQVTAAGWYPISLTTVGSSPRLDWQTPADTGWRPIPPSSLGH